MLASKPTIAVAALALGLHHSGVMGLVLEDEPNASATASTGHGCP